MYSARSLIARPGYTLVATLTLALGVGAAATMFSAVNSVLLKPLPYRDAGEVVVLRHRDTRDGTLEGGVSAANTRDIASAARTLSDAAVAEAHGLRLVEDGRAVSLRVWLVSDGFFEAIGARAELGRMFRRDEFVQGNEKVVLLSHRTWQTRFGGMRDIVGRQLILDGSSHTVVGVLPSTFQYPSPADVWGPRPPQPWDNDTRGRAQLEGVARLAPGFTVSQAQADVDAIASRLLEAHPSTNANIGLQLIPLREHLVGDVQTPLILLLGAVGLVLMVAAANVAGLQLARGTGKSREYALRGALGASSNRLVRLVAVESALLAGAGGISGIGFAFLGVHFVKLLGPNHLPRVDDLGLDGTVLFFALVAAIGSAFIAGVVPSFRAMKTNSECGPDGRFSRQH